MAEQLTEGVVAVDGKTAKQGLDDDGSPLHMLNVFVHDLQAVVGQWSTGAEKTNKPTLLRRHLAELLEAYPMLRLFTGDAIYAQRPLAELVCGHGRNYLFQIEANQGDTLDALERVAQLALEPAAFGDRAGGKAGHERVGDVDGPLNGTRPVLSWQ